MIEAVEISKKAARDGMEIFLRNFSHVPDDKLNWTPFPTAKSALRIAAHTALYYGIFAEMIQNRAVPQPENLEAWLSQRNAAEMAITSREEIKSIFEKGLSEVMTALDSLSQEDIASELDSGQGWSLSMAFVMNLPGWHATLHCGQIDFLQTCWGDQQIYVG